MGCGLGDGGKRVGVGAGGGGRWSGPGGGAAVRVVPALAGFAVVAALVMVWRSAASVLLAFALVGVCQSVSQVRGWGREPLGKPHGIMYCCLPGCVMPG